jgi:hypothetical protein
MDVRRGNAARAIPAWTAMAMYDKVGNWRRATKFLNRRLGTNWTADAVQRAVNRKQKEKSCR